MLEAPDDGADGTDGSEAAVAVPSSASDGPLIADAVAPVAVAEPEDATVAKSNVYSTGLDDFEDAVDAEMHARKLLE